MHTPKTKPKIMKEFYELQCPKCGSFRIMMVVNAPYEYKCLNCNTEIKIERDN
jgi:DNA-directed RNA polymerase subunit RPC12/RpoP